MLYNVAFCFRVALTPGFNSFLSSENDMNVLVRGVRFCMRVGRTECVKGVLEPKADPTDEKDWFYMGDVDPDRVRIQSLFFLKPDADAPIPTTSLCRLRTRR